MTKTVFATMIAAGLVAAASTASFAGTPENDLGKLVRSGSTAAPTIQGSPVLSTHSNDADDLINIGTNDRPVYVQDRAKFSPEYK